MFIDSNKSPLFWKNCVFSTKNKNCRDCSVRQFLQSTHIEEYGVLGYSLFDCDNKGQYPQEERTLVPAGTCRPDGPAGELLVPELRPAGDLHLRPRPHIESATK